MKKLMKYIVGFLMFLLVFSVPLNTKAMIHDDKQYPCTLCTKSKDDPLYEKERQFYDKIRIIKKIFGNSIDEVVLASTVLHKFGTNQTYKVEYTKNYDSSKYESMWSNYSASLPDIKGSKLQLNLSDEEKAALERNEKLDLLTIAAIVMVDSNHNGTYSDVCYRDGLAGKGLVGNTEDKGAFTVLANGIFCKAVEVDAVFDPLNYISNILNKDSFLITGLSTANRVINTEKVCENGYVAGLYSDINKVKDEDRKEVLKKARAQQIIDYANQFKKINGTYNEMGANCPIGGSIAGNTKGSDLIGLSLEDRIQKIGPAAQAVYSKTGIFASVTISQAIGESTIGKAYEGMGFLEANNLFGVRCISGKQCMNGYTVFNSLEESIEYRAELFDNGMYPEWKSKTTPEDFIRYIIPIYAPVDDGNSPDYPDELIGFINQYNLKKWDVKGNVSSNPNCGMGGSTGGWDIRTIKPDSSDKAFTEMESLAGNSNRGQCVWYAKGRAFEIVNNLNSKGTLNDSQASHIKDLLKASYGNGGEIYDNAKKVFNSSNDIKKPKAGSYIVWKQSNGYGHVAIVEEVNESSKTITITEGYSSGGGALSCSSDWSCVQFSTHTMSLDEFYNGFGKHYIGGYKFAGYVYFLEPTDMPELANIINNQGSSGTTGAYCKNGVAYNTFFGGSGSKIADLAVRVTPMASPDEAKPAPNAYPWTPPATGAGYLEYMDFERIMYETVGKYPSSDPSNPNNTGDGYNNSAYGSCAQAAGAIIRATVDPDFATGCPCGELEYLQNNPEKWVLAGEVGAGEDRATKCQPGDLLVTCGDSVPGNCASGSGHVMIYVGNALARAKFPNTKADVFEAAYGGSYSMYPRLSDRADDRTFKIYRPTGQGNFYYPFIDIERVLAG